MNTKALTQIAALAVLATFSMGNLVADDTMKKEALMMEKGKMMMMKEGKMMAMEDTMTLKDGTKVMKDGTVMMKNGEKMMMKNGDSIGMDGKMMHADKMKGEKK